MEPALQNGRTVTKLEEEEEEGDCRKTFGLSAIQNGRKVAAVDEEGGNCRKAFGLAARDRSGLLAPFHFSRRNNGEEDVTVKILNCGICHTDIHFINDDWQNTLYPIVPGHEIVGIVTETGRKVQNFNIGDRVGVGCLVGSCRSCRNCGGCKENYCPDMILTYNSICADHSAVTYGGLSNYIVVEERFVFKFPENLDMDKGAPLLCAGITVYSSMKSFGLSEPGKHVGIVGLGGLGHLAVKFGKAFGLKVTVISTSSKKKDAAINGLGADDFILSSDSEQMQAAIDSLDGIINTVPVKHDIVPLILLLKPHGRMVIVGAPKDSLDLPVLLLIMGGKAVAGSCTGGTKETREMLEFAGKHNISADIELISAGDANSALERLAKNDVRHRFVVDVGNTLAAA